MSITLQTVASGYNLSAINANFQSLQTALNTNILWRNGSVAGEAMMTRDLDMNGNAILNIDVDLDNPDSLLTLSVADERYYNVDGDVLEGNMDAGQNRITNLAAPSAQYDAIRKIELDAETLARQNADINLQDQLTGDVPLEASNFSEISWHSPRIANSVAIPPNKNAWSFGPQMEIAEGQLVVIGEGSTWTIADGRVVEDEDLHNLIADTIRTTDGAVTVNVADVATGSSVTALTTRVTAAEGNITSLTNRMTAEETKVQSVVLGGTGATTAATARTNLGAAASGANTDITSITGSAATLTTSRTFQTNLTSTSAASFNGSSSVTPGVTGTLPVTNGGTGGTTAATARTNLGAAASAGVVDASNAAAGVVGEVLSATTLATANTTATALNATSLTLTAGDWDVMGSIQFTPSASSYSVLNAGVNTTTAILPAFPYRFQLVTSTVLGAADQMFSVPKRRINVTTSTTIYLVASATFGSGTSTVSGFLEARRVR